MAVTQANVANLQWEVVSESQGDPDSSNSLYFPPRPPLPPPPAHFNRQIIFCSLLLVSKPRCWSACQVLFQCNTDGPRFFYMYCSPCVGPCIYWSSCRPRSRARLSLRGRACAPPLSHIIKRSVCRAYSCFRRQLRVNCSPLYAIWCQTYVQGQTFYTRRYCT